MVLKCLVRGVTINIEALSEEGKEVDLKCNLETIEYLVARRAGVGVIVALWTRCCVEIHDRHGVIQTLESRGLEYKE